MLLYAQMNGHPFGVYPSFLFSHFYNLRMFYIKVNTIKLTRKIESTLK